MSETEKTKETGAATGAGKDQDEGRVKKFTQEEVDDLIKRRLAREKSKFEKTVAELQQRIEEIEGESAEADKSAEAQKERELKKALKRLEDIEKKYNQVLQENQKYKIRTALQAELGKHPFKSTVKELLEKSLISMAKLEGEDVVVDDKDLSEIVSEYAQKPELIEPSQTSGGSGVKTGESAGGKGNGLPIVTMNDVNSWRQDGSIYEKLKDPKVRAAVEKLTFEG